MSLAEEVGLKAEVLLGVFSAEERQGLAPKENNMEYVFGQKLSKKLRKNVHLGRPLIFVQRRFDLFGQTKLRVVCDFKLGCVALYFLSNQSEQHFSLKAISPLRIFSIGKKRRYNDLFSTVSSSHTCFEKKSNTNPLLRGIKPGTPVELSTGASQGRRVQVSYEKIERYVKMPQLARRKGYRLDRNQKLHLLCIFFAQSATPIMPHVE